MTSDVSEVLLPCPFCRSGARFVKHSAGVRGTMAFDSWDAVACAGCGATVGACDRRFRSKDDARKAWNTRAQPAVLAVPVDDQNLMDEQHLRYCDRNIEASQAKGDADGVSFWHQWKAEYQRRIAAAPAIHADHVPDAGKMIHEGGEHA